MKSKSGLSALVLAVGIVTGGAVPAFAQTPGQSGGGQGQMPMMGQGQTPMMGPGSDAHDGPGSDADDGPGSDADDGLGSDAHDGTRHEPRNDAAPCERPLGFGRAAHDRTPARLAGKPEFESG